MSSAKLLDWRKAEPHPVVFISGPEDLLASRAIKAIRDTMKAQDGALEVHDLDAADYIAGTLLNLTSPSLFAEPRLLIIRNIEKCSDDLIIDGIAYLAQPTEDTTVILRHNGSSVRGKKLVEAIRSEHSAVEISCAEIKKDSERQAFVQAEFASVNRQISQGAIRALLDAFADDIAELAAACSQLLMDSAENITEEIVDRYYGGRVETNGFKVVDAALAGRSGEALSLLRHALSTGADPVPLVAAFALKIRQLAKLFGNRSASAQILGMAPWQLDRLRKEISGWTEDGLSNTIQALASADAAAKGAERDPIYSLEKLVQLVSSKGLMHA
ncbi:MAG: DNA polymerase III subunit delta [Rhodoluna sp.]